jgi:tetratricopeptide (TPR) repeat protein
MSRARIGVSARAGGGVVLALLASAQVARPAASQPKKGAPTTTATATTAADDQSASENAEALALFEQGRAAYRDGQFAESVKLFTKAYALQPEPVLLYNLARSQEGLGDYPAAVDAYERYLAQAKDVKDRGSIEQRVATLRKSIAEKERLGRERDEAERAKEQAKPRPAGEGGEPTAQTASPSPWPWALVGVGAAGVVVGGILGGLALSKNSSADGAPSQLEASDGRSSAEGLALGSTIAFIAGGAIAGVGLILGIADVATSSGEPEPAPAATVGLSVGLGAATLVVRF